MGKHPPKSPRLRRVNKVIAEAEKPVKTLTPSQRDMSVEKMDRRIEVLREMCRRSMRTMEAEAFKLLEREAELNALKTYRIEALEKERLEKEIREKKRQLDKTKYGDDSFDSEATGLGSSWERIPTEDDPGIPTTAVPADAPDAQAIDAPDAQAPNAPDAQEVQETQEKDGTPPLSPRTLRRRFDVLRDGARGAVRRFTEYATSQ